MKVWVNGCFDVLHVGHIKLLQYARSLGNVLVVGIDSDERVSKNKGEHRPFNTLEDRKYMLESIRYVDKVVIYENEQELEAQIATLGPDYLVIGSDWENKRVIGAQFAKKVCFFNRIGNYSTTSVLNGERNENFR